MGFLTSLFAESNYIYWIEILTIAAIIVLLCYVLFVLNIFRKR